MSYPTPLPGRESSRLATIAALDILDTPPERAFDDLTRIAALVCRTPVALVTLVDAERQWFKSRVGFALEQTSRDASFCAHAILHPGMLVVEDATQDPRFASNPLVTSEPHVRFYAGAPLVTSSGDAVGTLCVIDRVPRTLDATGRITLEALARQVVSQLELRRLVNSELLRVQELEMLQEVAIAILSALDVSEVLGLVARHLCALVPTARSAVFSYDRETSLLRGVAAWGTDEAPLHSVEIHVDELPAAERAMLDGHPAETQVEHPALRALGFSAAVCSALAARGEMLGLVVISDPGEEGRRPPGWESRLQRVTRLAALGLTTARAYRTARVATALGSASRAARDLHDEVAQILFALGVEAGAVLEEAVTPEARRHAERIVELSAIAGRQLRGAISALRGSRVFEDLGSALEQLVAGSVLAGAPKTEVFVAPALARAPGPRAELLFRVCREGMTNVIRHARASRCTVRCEIEDGWAIAAVEDDGVGLLAPEGDGHFGLDFLREAFERAGGSVEVQALQPAGTRLVARLPYEAGFT
jgi:signal transduction histidine kinase